MSDNAEEGIMRAQARAAQGEGTQKHHDTRVAYLDERILIYLAALVFIGLFVIWAVSSSALIRYGSLGVVIVLTILWSAARIRRIQRIRAERERQVKAMQSESSE